MAALPLSQTVDASSAKRRWRSSIVSLFTSTLIEGLVVAALVVAPLVAMRSLPEPQSRWSIGSYVPIVPTLPPAPVAPVRRAQTPPRTRPPSTTAVIDRFVAPGEVPDGVVDEPAFESGVTGGIPAGVVGGIGAPIVNFLAAEPAPPATQRPMRPGGDVRYPRKIHHVNPSYPRLAREARVQGVVRLETTIDTEGKVVDLRVVDSVALLDAAAIEAVRQWKYEPSTLNGQPVPVLLTVEVVFRLSK